MDDCAFDYGCYTKLDHPGQCRCGYPDRNRMDLLMAISAPVNGAPPSSIELVLYGPESLCKMKLFYFKHGDDSWTL